MDHLLEQINKGLEVGLYQMCLSVTLCLPDICGALDSPNGKATGKRYKDWFSTHLSDKYGDRLTAEDCYYIRCSYLHQGSTQHKNSTYERIIFVEPNSPIQAHLALLDNVLVIDIIIFCQDIIEAVRKWLAEVEETELFQNNYNKFFRRYPNGLPPYFVGHPLIS